MRSTILSLALILVSSLGSQSYAQAPLQFAELEDRLLNARELSLDFKVTASGAVTVSIEGKLVKQSNGDVALSATGQFAGQDVDLIARTRDDTFQYGGTAAPILAEPPAALWEALIIGFTRMGVLHNIATLSANAMPDHASGGVADWVRVSNVGFSEGTYAFDIVVSETPSGSALLSLDSNGNPLEREQTVAFPGGEMRVVETYSNISIGS